MGLAAVRVRGFKSIAQWQEVRFGKLTVLAGANSSGKSSMMQSLLLLKQTLDAPYDPGALLLNGPNVRFTSVDQALCCTAHGKSPTCLEFEMELGEGTSLRLSFSGERGRGFSLNEMVATRDSELTTLRPEMSQEEIVAVLPASLPTFIESLAARRGREAFQAGLHYRVVRERCFLMVEIARSDGSPLRLIGLSPASPFPRVLREIIHLPGLRGNPTRTYPLTAVGDTFPGTFETYVASVITQWQRDDNKGLLTQLSHWLAELRLTTRVEAKQLDDAQVELRVGRALQPLEAAENETVSIADVGFGVSQVLPVLVALLVCPPGGLVYVEQPELHLHPHAQARLATVLTQAVKRGTRVVVETHSSTLVRSLQTAVAKGEIPPGDVGLHWFHRDEAGVTTVSRAKLDTDGAFGTWPADFDEVILTVEEEYLQAVQKRHFAG